MSLHKSISIYNIIIFGEYVFSIWTMENTMAIVYYYMNMDITSKISWDSAQTFIRNAWNGMH